MRYRLHKRGQARIVEIRKSKLWGHPNFTTGQALRQSSGQAALALIFLIGGTVLLVGATLAFLIFNFVHSTFGFLAANRALGVALAGTNDALAQLTRNRSFNLDPPAGNCAYNFLVGEDKAEVQVLWYNSGCNGSNKPVSAGNCFDISDPSCHQVAVNVDANVSGRRRRVEMLVSVNSITGEVDIISLRQKLGGYGGGGCAVSC